MTTGQADTNVVAMKTAEAEKPKTESAPAAKEAKKPTRAKSARKSSTKSAVSAKAKATTSKQSSAPLSPTKPLEDIMTKNTAQFDQLTQETAALSDAMSKSYGIMAKGYENLLRTTMEISQAAAEKQATFAKQALSCKSLNELAEMQSKVAQSSMEDFMSGATKISELSTKVLTESAAPISEQLNKAMHKMKQAA